MANDCRAVGCKVTDRGLFCCLFSRASLIHFSNPRFLRVSRYCDVDNTQPQDRWQYSMVIAHCTNRQTNGWCYKLLSYKHTLFYKCMFPHCSGLQAHAPNNPSLWYIDYSQYMCNFILFAKLLKQGNRKN